MARPIKDFFAGAVRKAYNRSAHWLEKAEAALEDYKIHPSHRTGRKIACALKRTKELREEGDKLYNERASKSPPQQDWQRRIAWVFKIIRDPLRKHAKHNFPAIRHYFCPQGHRAVKLDAYAGKGKGVCENCGRPAVCRKTRHRRGGAKIGP